MPYYCYRLQEIKDQDGRKFKQNPANVSRIDKYGQAAGRQANKFLCVFHVYVSRAENAS
jgi:hypothetical protein